MEQLYRFVGTVAAVGLCAVLYGCGGGGASDAPELYGVTGKITKGGQPLSGIKITMIPEGAGPEAVAYSGDDGTFTMATATGGEGAAAGQYKIVLQASDTASTDASRYSGNSGQPPPQAEAPFPKEYTAPSTSPESFEVKPGGDNILNIEIPV